LPPSGKGYVDPPSVKVHHQGKEVIALGVSMAKGETSSPSATRWKNVRRHREQSLPAGIKLVQLQDQPKVGLHIGERVCTGAD